MSDDLMEGQMGWFSGWFKREKRFGMTITDSRRGKTLSYKDPMSGVTKTYRPSGKSYTTRIQKAGGWTRRTRSKI